MNVKSYKLSVVILSVLFFQLYMILPASAQNARLQLIHNSGDIDAANLEVEVNGDSTLTIAFRAATPFMEFAAGDYIFRFVATIGTETDTSAADTVTLAENTSYVGIINGITATNIGEGRYDNPFSRDISMSLYVLSDVRETASQAGKVEFVVFHGSTDAPAVDVLVDGGAVPLVDNLDYGQNTNYIAVDPAVYTLDLTPANDNLTLLGRFEADLSALADSAAVVFAAGFAVPENNQGASRVGIFAALPNGNVITFEDVTPGEPGPWTDAGLSEYEFDGFVGADTLVNGGHGIVVDKYNRIWLGNFNAASALRIINPDGSEVDFSPIDSLSFGGVAVIANNCRGLGVAADGDILFARSSGYLFKINVDTGEEVAMWQEPASNALLKPAVDAQGFIYAGLVVGINPVHVIDPRTFTEAQQITLPGAPSFGRGLDVRADGLSIITPDLGASGGPVYIWTSSDQGITYAKADSIMNNTGGRPIFLTQRTTLDWAPDSTLWISSDNAYAAGNNDPNGFVILNFDDLTYKFLPSPEIAPNTGNGPRGVAFSVTGDTAYATYFNGNRCARFVRESPNSVNGPNTVLRDYVLEQNYPNPFNPTTTIAFRMAKQGEVELKIYNLLGQEMATLIDKKRFTEGRHNVTFDASTFASGVYYYKLKVNDIVLSRKMTLLK